MNRRQVIEVMLLAIFATLTGCFRSIVDPSGDGDEEVFLKSQLGDFIAEGSIAAFLENRELNVIYHENTDWSFPQGDFEGLLYMVDFQGHGLYGYEIYVDGHYVPGAINSISFSPRRQRMRIDHYGQTIWRHKPSRRSDVHMHRELIPEPR